MISLTHVVRTNIYFTYMDILINSANPNSNTLLSFVHMDVLTKDFIKISLRKGKPQSLRYLYSLLIRKSGNKQKIKPR